MINYYVELAEISNNVIGTKKSILNYETEILPINQEEQNELIKEIISKTEHLFSGTVIITELIPTYMFLERNNRTDDPLYKESKDNWEKAKASDDYQIKRLNETYKDVINTVKLVVKSVKDRKLEDTQEYLDFLDNLNEISVSH